MAYTIKKVIYTLLAAVICAAAAGAFCLFTAVPEKNASALICFTEISENQGTVDTGTSRSVSALRKAVRDKEFLSSLSVSTGISESELKRVVSVERFGNSDGVEIIISGMKNSAEAPIILINLLYLAETSDNIQPFEIISSCEIAHEPAVSPVVWILSSGLFGALVCFLVMSLRKRHVHHYYRPVKSEADGGEYYEAVSMQEYIHDAYNGALDLGNMQLSAPDGIENSVYPDAADRLLRKCGDNSPAVIAVSSDFYHHGESVSSQAKITAYLACAFVAKGLRTVIIECDLKHPSLGRLFRSADKGGLSDIAAGNCTIWDALAINAKNGIDVIVEKKSYPAPMAVFASPAFSQLMSYLSGQYDVMLMYAPRAWECEEWKLIERRCTGVLVVTEENSMLSANAARGMLAKSAGFYAVCSVRAESHDKKEGR